MNKKIIAGLSVAMVLLILTSCTRKGIVSDYPFITITTPTNGQSIASGAAIHITGTALASDNDDSHLLHEVAVTIKTLPDSLIIFNAVYDAHDLQSFNIDTTFTPIVTSNTDMVIVGQAVNHLYKIAVKNVGFTVNH